ncbi:hypothetical protein RRG08_062795 [Elysia crispata]|uniref:Uncharacterized protein n=1 Tax=Elysia crispata TaxID=231223 RepID=A0AAE1ATP6_9GAST|nr:hypothetical protein RRG08_062795 [Elysia crispata]
MTNRQRIRLGRQQRHLVLRLYAETLTLGVFQVCLPAPYTEMARQNSATKMAVLVIKHIVEEAIAEQDEVIYSYFAVSTAALRSIQPKAEALWSVGQHQLDNSKPW